MGLSLAHLALLLAAVVLLFGRGRIVELMDGCARGLRAVRRGIGPQAQPVPQPIRIVRQPELRPIADLRDVPPRRD